MDNVNHPSHYADNGPVHSCGKTIECIDVAETFNFNLGNAVKYIWRHADKQNPVEDLKKARWYLEREIDKYDQ